MDVNYVIKFQKLKKNIVELLNSLNIIYVYQYKASWLGNQSLDFYLPDYNIAIECQGLQHVETVRFGGMSIEKSIDKYNRRTDIEIITNFLNDLLGTAYNKNGIRAYFSIKSGCRNGRECFVTNLLVNMETQF